MSFSLKGKVEQAASLFRLFTRVPNEQAARSTRLTEELISLAAFTYIDKANDSKITSLKIFS